jgi:hypothetical protein
LHHGQVVKILVLEPGGGGESGANDVARTHKSTEKDKKFLDFPNLFSL